MINIMPSRIEKLQQDLLGYQQTHAQLVALIDHKLQAAGIGNDLGTFYFVIKLSTLFHWSVTTAFEVFLTGIILIGMIAGVIGITLLWKKSKFYWWSITAIVILSLVSYKVGDVYAAASSVVIGLVPFIILLCRKTISSPKYLFAFFSIGMLCGIANSIRAQSGTAVLCFALFLLIFSAFSLTNKVKIFLLLFVGSIIPGLWLGHLIQKRDDYITTNQPGYTKSIVDHPFWHTAYIGFGYLNNDFGIKYLDQVGMDTVVAINPKVAFLSPQYESILRTQTLNLVRSQPLFAIMTIFSKLGVILLLYLPFFANLGLWKAWKNRLGGKEFYPFYAALVFAALTGIIAIPDLRYVLGFAAFALLYGLAVLNHE